MSLRDLVLQRGHQLGVVVAQGVDGDAAQRVEVLACRSRPTRGSPGRATVRWARGHRCSSRGARWLDGSGRRILQTGRTAQPPVAATKESTDSGAIQPAAPIRMTIAHHRAMHAAGGPVSRASANSYIRVKMPGCGNLRSDPAPSALTTPRSDGCPFQQRSLHPRRHQQRKTFRPSDWAERLAGVMSVSPRWRPAWQPPELLALVHSHHHGRRQMRGGAPRPARPRADGLGLRDELRARQRPATGRGLLLPDPPRVQK